MRDFLASEEVEEIEKAFNNVGQAVMQDDDDPFADGFFKFISGDLKEDLDT
jgi:hypothetical protein